VVGDSRRLEPLGYHTLRGVRDRRKIYALDLGFKAEGVSYEEGGLKKGVETPLSTAKR